MSSTRETSMEFPIILNIILTHYRGCLVYPTHNVQRKVLPSFMFLCYLWPQVFHGCYAALSFDILAPYASQYVPYPEKTLPVLSEVRLCGRICTIYDTSSWFATFLCPSTTSSIISFSILPFSLRA
jgi:hypothetical protein